MFEFWKNEWELFLDDLGSVKQMLRKMFGVQPHVLMLETAEQQDKAEAMVEEEFKEVYENDAIDNKVAAYFGEDIDTIRQNTSGDKTQHEVLREYAQYFKPYSASQEMCNSAFRKYYDRHALDIATNEVPVDQLRIVQNNVDIFIQGQEVFGDNEQFIDSRVDTIFSKIGKDQIKKVVNILHDSTEDGINAKGERLFAESIHYMVDNGVKFDKNADVIKPLKEVLQEKLNQVHLDLKNQDNLDDKYQQLISDERKYLYALNRIDQFETEQRISEYSQNLDELDITSDSI